MTISEDDLSTWEALCAAATPGEWTATGHSVWSPITEMARCRDYNPKGHDDAAFIAAARTAVPDLCAEVRQLRVQRSAFRLEADALRAAVDATVAVQQANLAERDALRIEASELRSEAAAARAEIGQLNMEKAAIRLLASLYRSAHLSGERLTRTDEEYLADMRAVVVKGGGR